MTRTASPRLLGYASLAAVGLVAALALRRPELAVVAAPFALLLAIGTRVVREPQLSVDVVLAHERTLEGAVVDAVVAVRTDRTFDRLELLLRLPRGMEVADGFDPHDLAAAGVTRVLGADELAAARTAAASVGVSEDVLAYVVDLARATRRSPSMRLGVSPRATTALLAASKAWAWLTGYDSLTPDHVQAMLLPVWRHRVQLRPEAELEGVSVDAVLRSIVQQVQVPL